MAPSEHTDPDAASQPVLLRRTVVYVVAAIALVVVGWALIEGGERDLWSQPGVLFRGASWAILPR